jgi:MDMPI C-terminal domain
MNGASHGAGSSCLDRNPGGLARPAGIAGRGADPRAAARALVLRRSGHVRATWDVAAATDPGATVAPDAVGLLIDNVPGFLAPRLGRAPDVAFRVHVRTTDPERDYLLIAADPVSMADWPGDGAGADGEVRMPAEALLRLAYGRLDPGHTPAGVEGDPANLDRMRRVFPGF